MSMYQKDSRSEKDMSDGYLLRVPSCGKKPCLEYIGVALDPPILALDTEISGFWQRPLIIRYCDSEDDRGFIVNLKEAWELKQHFEEAGLKVMILGISFKEDIPSKDEGVVLGYDVAHIGGDFESLVLDDLIMKVPLDQATSKPEYPIWDLLYTHFSQLLNEHRLFKEASDAKMFLEVEMAMSVIVPEYFCTSEDYKVCRVTLLE